MADRVSASITLGGKITTSDYDALAEIVVGEALSVEWDGETFELAHRTVGESLGLYAHEVAWGRFETLETWCVEKKLPFVRWSGAYASQWGAQRVVFMGQGEPTAYAADEDDCVVICRETAEKLGSIEAIRAYFDGADFMVPPLIVDGDPDA
jgi:hypothetical protein